jgi:hypothetical protein
MRHYWDLSDLKNKLDELRTFENGRFQDAPGAAELRARIDRAQRNLDKLSEALAKDINTKSVFKSYINAALEDLTKNMSKQQLWDLSDRLYQARLDWSANSKERSQLAQDVEAYYKQNKR